MNQSMKIQMDIKNNAQDLQNYVLDLKNWEKEMKKKELELTKNSPLNPDYPPPRNRIKRNKVEEKEKSNVKSKAKKISGYDYSAWDKYDVDKACAELDDEENVQNNDNNIEESIYPAKASDNQESSEDDDDDDDDKLSLIDQAVYEKELGNQHVKKEQWNEAIKCYTKAINLDSKNPIYYANRSLCFLKLKNFRASEVDAMTALQLDKNYVKAYQRRGYARLALGQLAEAKADFEEVLKMEPKNSLMSLEINKINEKLKKEFSKSQPQSTFNHKNLFKPEVKKEKVKVSVEAKSEKTVMNVSDNSEKNVNSITKPQIKSVKESKEPLNDQPKTIMENKNKANENNDKKTEKGNETLSSVFGELPPHCKIIQPIEMPPHKRSNKPLKSIPIIQVFSEPDLDGNDGSLNRIKPEVPSRQEIDITTDKYADDDTYNLDIPKTSVQFQNNWKVIKKHPDDAWKYLKKVANKLPEILDNSLESDLFSDLIKFLATQHSEREPFMIYILLKNLSKVKRFTSMTMFMSKKDKDCARNCISGLNVIMSESVISELLSLYELQNESNLK